MKKFAIVFFASLLVTLTSFGGPPTILRNNGIDVPADSFGFVMAISMIKKEGCEQYVCEFEPSISTASAVIVSRDDRRTRLLTAGHFCAVVETGETQIAVKDHKGEVRLVTSQVYSEQPDLCLIETDGAWGRPLSISNKKPVLGDTAWNIAAPYGIFDNSLLLTFSGTYSGIDSKGNDWYTIPAAPGSSGSPILNKRGEIIGIIHSAFMSLPHISLSSKIEDIKSFLKKANDELDLHASEEIHEHLDY